jgi:PAS domain S-box-containing protein
MGDLERFGILLCYAACGLLLLALWRAERSRHLLSWTYAWWLFALRGCIDVSVEEHRRSLLVQALAWLALFAAVTTVAWGTHRFLGVAARKTWYLVGAIALLTSLLGLAAGMPRFEARFPIFVFFAVTLWMAAWTLLKSRQPGFGRWTCAGALAVSGIWSASYPYLAGKPWVEVGVPHVDLGLALLCACGGVLLHFERWSVEHRALMLEHQTLFDSAPIGLFRLNSEGRFMTANPALLRLLRVDSVRCAKLQLADVVVHGVDQQAIDAARESKEELLLQECLWRRCDGSEARVELRIRTVVDVANGERWLDGSAQDVTSERELRQQLEQTERLESLGRLAGGIAHDVNNVLTTVIQGTELAQRQLPEGAPAIRALEVVREAALGAAEFTRQLLAFSRRRVAGKKPCVLQDAVAAGARAIGLERQMQVAVCRVLDPEPLVVLAQPGQTEQLVMNLLLNAIDAMPDGGTLTISATRGAVDGAKSGAVLTVSDTGHGMDEATRLRVFEPFFTTKSGKGTGLGLSTVYGIARQLGWSVSVQSTVNVGTSFTVNMPLTELPAAARSAGGVARRPAPGTRVLLVEDVQSLRLSVQRSLTELGFDVQSAADGKQALALAREQPFDLLLTDVIMPGITGPELARRLRMRKPDLPVVFMSGFAEEQVLGPDAGSSPFIGKPFTTQELAAALGEALPIVPSCAPRLP